MDEFVLPLMVRTPVVLLIFLGFVLFFHLLLVWPRNLSKRGWKLIDYVWLTIAVLGIFGSLATNRKDAATSLKEMASFRVAAAGHEINSAIEFGNSAAICRRFIASELSPPPDELARIQAQFDLECAWFKAAKGSMAMSAIGRGEALHIEDLGPLPAKGGDNFAVENLTREITRYNLAIQHRDELGADSLETALEQTIRYLGPLLLVMAIALRIAKVSGELRHHVP